MASDLSKLLERFGLEHYDQLLRDHQVDGGVLAHLRESDLKKLGISLGHRKKFRRVIEVLQGEDDAPGTAMSLPWDSFAEPLVADRTRRQLTLTFFDLVRSTELASRLDPEDMQEVLTQYQQVCSHAIRRYEGHVANFIGDGILAFFGFPQAHEDDAERAVRAALDATRAVAELRVEGAAGLRMRAGIATGVVIIGSPIGEGGAREHPVTGKAPNLAARLQALAEPGAVVVAPNTVRLLGNLFELADLGLQELKGFAEPVRAYTVLGPSRVASRFEAFHPRALTPMVGRDQEFGRLLTSWTLAERGAGRVVLVSGEAGIGKSRLIGALEERLRPTGGAALRFFCSAYHAESALWPVIAQLERAGGIDPADDDATRLDKLVALLETAGPVDDETVVLLAGLLGIKASERYPPLGLAPQAGKRRLLNVLIERIDRLSRARPRLVIIEDVHWIDPTTRELLDGLVRRVQDLPVLLVVTSRSEAEAPWLGLPHVSALPLNRLARAAVTRLAELIAGKPLPAEVVEQIHSKTDGVALFVEELTKTVIEAGLLRETERAFVLEGPLPPLAVPATLQGSLTARLDRLADVKDVAQTGAVIGREFPYRLLAGATARPDADLTAALERLLGAGLILEDGAPPHAVYRFKHALVRDAAYHSLLRERRQQLHATVARSLESMAGATAEHQPELLAQHYAEAGLDEQALAWWRRAGELASRRSANIEAIRHFDRALELLNRRPEDGARDALELTIRTARSGPLIAVGGYVSFELEANFARAWELCERTAAVEPSFPILYGRWVIPFVHGDIRRAVANGQRFLERAIEQDDRALIMIGHRLLGSGLVWRARSEEGCAHLQQALAMFVPEQHDALAFRYSQHPKVAALSHLCLGLQHRGDLDQAMAAGNAAIEEARRQAHFNSVAYALCFVGLMLMLRRDAGALRATTAELVTIADAHGAAYWKLWAEIMLGWLQIVDGEVDQGLSAIRRSTSILQHQKADVWVPQSLLLEAEIRMQRSEFDDASQLLEQAGALILAPEQRYYEIEWRRLQARLLQATGASPDRIAAAYTRALETARAQRSRFFELRVATDLARSPKVAPAPRTRARLRALCARFPEGVTTPDLADARAVLERPL